jgi:hypothetical protein
LVGTVYADGYYHGGKPRDGAQGTNEDRVTKGKVNVNRDTSSPTNADRQSNGKPSGWRNTRGTTNRYRG